MRRCVLFLLVLSLLTGMTGCGPDRPGGTSETVVLLGAVPSDAVYVGISSRLERALEASLDSSSVLLSLDYGKVARNAGAVALCDIGSIVPLALVDLGKHAADTSAGVRAILADADSIAVRSAIVELGERDLLLLTPSETVMTIVRRHLAAETSILDAPDFNLVTEVLTHNDARIWRSRAVAKLPVQLLKGVEARKQYGFLAGASEWMVVSDGRIIPVQPEGGSYFCNYFAPVGDAPSRIAPLLPEAYDSVTDLPIGDTEEFRKAYEAWLDARVMLVDYQLRVSALRKSSGKSPLVWEKDARVQEVAALYFGPHRLNMVRTASEGEDSDDIVPNPQKGYLNCLYGNIFEATDSLCIRRGDWCISGQREALESYLPGEGKAPRWPARAKLVLDSGEMRIIWTKEEIRIWDSNR